MAIQIHRTGEQKPDPFTILVIANPVLEAPWESGQLVRDPILGDQAGFDAAVTYVEDALFGRLPGQAERLLGDPAIAPRVRLTSFFDATLPIVASNALVGQDGLSSLLVARRAAIVDFLASHDLAADIVYAISRSASHERASAWFASDDESSPGVPFVLDGVTRFHRTRSRIPGTIAMHRDATSLTAAHELGHAVSSYENGKIVDLYVDSSAAVNIRRGRPIPATFGALDGEVHASDPTRDHLGYPAGWTSYHAALLDPARPALMDNYWLATPPEASRNDGITRAFILGRVRAKLER